MVMKCSKRDGSGTYHYAFKEFPLSNGTRIGVFQGSYGNNPDLDILVKYQEPGKQVRTPQHIHWAIDLLIKNEHNPQLTKEFVKYLADMWSQIQPFTTKEQQQQCQLYFTNPENLVRFVPLNSFGEYSVEFIGHIIELLMIEEKTGNKDAFMFIGVLNAIFNNEDIFTIAQRATYRG
jgi:hypothetical protein